MIAWESFSWTRVFTALVALLLLGGCLGSPDEVAPGEGPGKEMGQKESQEGDDDPAKGGVAEMQRKALRFALDDELDEEARFKGSFEPQETGLGGGFVTGDFQVEIDWSDRVPAGVPVRVEASVRLDAAEIPLLGPTGRVDPVSNDTVWYEMDWKTPEPGRGELSGVVKRAEEGTLGFVLEAYAPGHEAPPDVQYTVQVRITAVADEVPDGVPVALMLNGNETIVFESWGEGDAEVVVFAPDDELVGRVLVVGEQEWTTPRDLSGEYVVMAAHGSESLRIYKQVERGEEPGSLRALGFEREQGEPVDVEPMDETSWRFEVDRVPLRVQLSLVGPGGEGWVCYGTASISLESPEEQVIDRGVECPSPTNVPFLYEEVWTWSTLVGDKRMVTGTYEGVVEADLLEGFQARHAIEWYKR